MAASLTQANMSRRRALQLALGAGVGGPLLAACGRDDPDGGTPTDEPSSPGAVPQLSGEVSLAMPLAFEGTEDFYRDALAKFETDTGVKVNFLPFPDPQYADSIQGLFQSGDAPDVYRMIKPPAIMASSFDKGWIQPLDSYQSITDTLANDYGDSALDPSVSGLHIEGKLYGVPGIDNNKIAVFPLMINPVVFDQYGVAVPETWSEYREAAAKITTDSGGDVAGIAFVQDAHMLSNTQLLRLFAQAGPVRKIAEGVLIDLQTGKAAAAHQSLVDAVALLRGFVEDGSVLAGWQNMDPESFFPAWVAGKAAMTPTAAWWVTSILQIDDQAPYELVKLPLPDSGRGGYLTVGSEWLPTWGMSKDAQNTEAAAALIAHLGSLKHQRNDYQATASNCSLYSKMTDILDDNMKQTLAISDEVQRLGPNADVRSLDARELVAQIQATLPEPGLDRIVFEAVNDGTDYAAEAAAYDAKLQKVIDDQIDAAIADGADFDENIFAFPDWDPAADEDYATEPIS